MCFVEIEEVSCNLFCCCFGHVMCHKLACIRVRVCVRVSLCMCVSMCVCMCVCE